MTQAEILRFRAICAECGLAATHQRQVIFEVLQGMSGHPNPEEVYARVRKRIPAISLATVYKNLHLFIETGIFREVSVHHGSLRMEVNSRPHYHLVCTSCRTIVDLDEKDLKPLPKAGRIPGGFKVERFAIDVLGLCNKCQN